MHQTYPTDIFRERQLTLLREAEERRLVRQLRAARSRGHSRSRGGWQGSGGRSPCGDGPALRSSGLRGSQAERGLGGQHER